MSFDELVDIVHALNSDQKDDDELAVYSCAIVITLGSLVVLCVLLVVPPHFREYTRFVCAGCGWDHIQDEEGHFLP